MYVCMYEVYKKNATKLIKVKYHESSIVMNDAV